MSQTFIRTKAAIEDCKNHLQEAEAYGTPVEAYLTQYLIVVLCADMEQALHEAIVQRCDEANDSELSSFSGHACRKLLRSVKKDEIAGLVGQCGQHCKDALNAAVDDQQVTYYNNAVLNRHAVAHSQGPNLTFSEIESAVTAAEDIVDAVRLALSSHP